MSLTSLHYILKFLSQKEDIGTRSPLLDRSLPPCSRLVFPFLTKGVRTLGRAPEVVPPHSTGTLPGPRLSLISTLKKRLAPLLGTQAYHQWLKGWAPDPMAPPSLSRRPDHRSPFPVISFHLCLCLSLCFRDLFLYKGCR